MKCKLRYVFLIFLFLSIKMQLLNLCLFFTGKVPQYANTDTGFTVLGTDESLSQTRAIVGGMTRILTLFLLFKFLSVDFS